MGFDLHGVAPKINQPEPKILKDNHWSTVTPDLREAYTIAWDEHEKVNPGIYFRNNAWWWRPLWTYVCNICHDILTQKDMVKGTWNNFDTISKTKGIKIAARIMKENKSGALDKYAQGYEEAIAKLDKEDCMHCNGTGKRDDEHVKGKCNGCEGTGKREAWAASYPFSVENALQFAKFAKESGGFQIS